MLAATRVFAPDPGQVADLGLIAVTERREPEVLAIVTATAERVRNDARLWHVLGLLHRALGQLTPAIAAFNAALRLTPDSARLVHARARASYEAGLDSLDWYARARRLAPGDSDVLLGEAAALLAAGRGDSADTLLSGLLRQHPGWLAGHAAVVQMRFASGRDDWLDLLDGAIAGAPLDPRLRHLKIILLHRRRDAEGAAAALRDAREAGVAAEGLAASAAMLAAEYGTAAEAEAAYAGRNPAGDADLAVHWLRHLLRHAMPERARAFAAGLRPGLAHAVQPYLALSQRLLGDPLEAQLAADALVRVIDFGEDWPLLTPLAAVVRDLHKARHEPLDQSVRGGTQTDGPLLWRSDPTIQEARAAFDAAVADYIEGISGTSEGGVLAAKRPRHPRIVGSWSVRLTAGGYHDPHIHGDGWLSSAFYLALPPAGAAEAGWLTIGEPQAELGLSLPPLRMVEPKPGRLVLFPSTMWHGTRQFEAGERLTLAFDIG